MKTKAQFDRVYRTGRKVRGNGILVAAAANSLDFSRFGYIVTTKAGKAVHRNRGRRWMREFTRANIDRIRPGWDVVMRLGNPGALESFSDTTTDLEALMVEAELMEPQGVC